MRSQKHTGILNYETTIVAVLLFCILTLPSLVSGDTASVTNVVSASSDGNGETHASVRTTVNGVVVEDISSESGSIVSHVEVDGASTTAYVITSSGTSTNKSTLSRTEELRLLIEKLKEIIQLYVLLQHTQK